MWQKQTLQQCESMFLIMYSTVYGMYKAAWIYVCCVWFNPLMPGIL